MARRLNILLLQLMAERRARQRARSRAEQRAMRAMKERHGDNESRAELVDAVGAKARRKRHRANLRHAKTEAAKPSVAAMVEALHTEPVPAIDADIAPPAPRSNFSLPENLSVRRSGHYLSLKAPELMAPAPVADTTTKKRKRHPIDAAGQKLAVGRFTRISASTPAGRVGQLTPHTSSDVWLGIQR